MKSSQANTEELINVTMHKYCDFFRCFCLFFFYFCATVLSIANENQVWEKIIHDKNCKTTRVFIPESFFLNRTGV